MPGGDGQTRDGVGSDESGSAAPGGSGAPSSAPRVIEDERARTPEDVELILRVLDRVSGMVAYWDKDQRCRFANAAYETWFGVKPHALLGTTLVDLLGPLYSKNLPFIEAALRGEAQTFEREIPDPAGGPARYSQAHYVPDVSDGVVRGFVVSVFDITARRRLEEELARVTRATARAEALEMFRLVVEAAPNANVVVDQTGRIVLVNMAAETLFGYARSELIGQRMDLLLPEPLRAAHRGHLRSYFIERRPRRMGSGRDLFGRRKDGSEVPVEIGLSPIESSDGPMTLAAIIDISERQRQAAALRLSNEELERSNIELQRFAFIASHDLQTPLRSIGSFLDLLGSTYSDKLDEQGRDWIRRATQSAKLLQRLVRDTLEYSKLESRARAFARIPFRAAFDEAISLLESAIREVGAEVTAGELPEVSGDLAQLVQLMLNLVGNALKYRGSEAPRVHVSAERRGNDWTISVQDNGIGIAPRHQERIFEMFKRLHDQSQYPGSGLGLAVCRRIVTRHGGKIWVESDGVHGSVFRFTMVVPPKEEL